MTARVEFYWRKSLPKTDSRHMDNMADWLRYYNELDVFPLVQAMEFSFSKFHEFFNVDPALSLTLPSLAFK